MERGLLWLPLLAVFIGLAWSGWNEYQKLEAYQAWATNFDKAKYDIYAVLGLKETDLTWGKPTRKGPVNLETFSLKQVESLGLLVENQAVDPNIPPEKGKAIALEFRFTDTAKIVQIPFTEISLAVRWYKYLHSFMQSNL
ncbi:hypothetical protein [Planktothrix paucivesiculata]|uniref:Uncharacterized protein n=1 Tax=Planktothrix paucivesiculata PCC 9631 TaxID=671071 RepID=A0A7Z9BRF6_9CYAN|nr:hypothetical protein [Planktothrix paucivesiculata]VXD15708.1 conserved exported hypothetical protein [Planktothrix paucivesiculata PCC 9631]